MRYCPHGIPEGPLDSYGVPDDQRIFSTYCAACYREQSGHEPPESERYAYTEPELTEPPDTQP